MRACRLVAETGGDHIIGSHPHVIQPMELRTNGNQQHAIVYSLGNFISNMSAANTDGGLIFTLQLEKYPLPKPIRPLPPPKTIQVIHRRPNLLPLLFHSPVSSDADTL